MILAIGNSSIYEIEYFNLVLEYIRKNGEDAVMYKQDQCLNHEYIDFFINSEYCKTSITIDNKTYNVEDFSAIWYLKPYLPKELITFPNIEYREFIIKQFKYLRESLFDLFANKIWLPNPHRMFQFSNKISQLDLAMRCNFNVPATLISSNPSTAKKFIDNHNIVIAKQLATIMMTDKALFTNIISPNDLKAIDSIRFAPCILQEYVHKSFDVRVVYINGKIFASLINSQKDKNTSVDWRKKPDQTAISIEPYILDNETQKSILQFMHQSNMNFGCFDFAMSTDNKLYFLEINPNGQWYFLDNATVHKIASEIANYLCNKTAKSDSSNQHHL